VLQPQQQQQDPLQQPVAITMPLGAWQAVLEILQGQPYAKVAGLIASIIEQANRAQAQAQQAQMSAPPPPMPNGGLNPYSPPNDGT
jgi:hypothetical protein